MQTISWTSQRRRVREGLFAVGLAATLLLPAVAGAQAFIPTGNLNEARFSHAAVRLRDGRVLVVGGYAGEFGCCSALASAEIYDPATKTFTRTGPMAQTRVSPLVIALPSGKVLVAGGYGSTPGTGALATAELYDPEAGTFSPTGTMLSGHLDGTATLLTDGTVLVAGGSDEFGNLLDTAETYDPASGTFSATGAMPEARWSHAAALLPGGAVLLAGGCAYPCSNRGVRYDPATRTFSLTSPQIGNRQRPTARTLPDGRVLVAGGYDASGELYDDVTRTFTYAGPMVEFRQGRDAASLLPSGNVLITGWSAGAEIFTAGSGFSPTASMQVSRDQPSTTELLDGTVLIAGGGNYFPYWHSLRSADIFDENYVDTVPPSLSVPVNFTMVAQDETGAAVYFFVTATDNVDPNPLVVCEPPSGSIFPIGDTTVNCVATDAAGNSASRSFVVTLIPPLKMAVTLPKTAKVDARTGVVTITGLVSCNRPATGFLSGTLTQEIARRATLTGFFGSFIDCSGSGDNVWTATITPSSGRFVAGQASVATSSYVCETFSCTSQQQSGNVILAGK